MSMLGIKGILRPWRNKNILLKFTTHLCFSRKSSPMIVNGTISLIIRHL